MARYLIVESRDPFESRDVGFVLQNARELGERGNQVVLYLIENGVFFARREADQAYVKALKDLAEGGVEILAEDISLRQRGIPEAALNRGVRSSNMDEFVDLLMEKTDKVYWH